MQKNEVEGVSCKCGRSYLYERPGEYDIQIIAKCECGKSVTLRGIESQEVLNDMLETGKMKKLGVPQYL